jgi:PAS domain S-box-containing protein
LLSLLLRQYIESDIFVLFVAAVWLSAWFHGRTGGFTACALSAATVFFFIMSADSAAIQSHIAMATERLQAQGMTFAEARAAALHEFGSSVSLFAVVMRTAAFTAVAALVAWLTAAWRENRRLLEATLSGIGDAVIAADLNGRVTFLNPVAETLTGWPTADARGRGAQEILRLLDEATHESIENPVARALRERATVALLDGAILVSRNGVESPVEVAASPVRGESSAMRGAILVFRDIGKRRQLEEQATHAEKMEAVTRLARGMAGDFNNVLTVITGYAELLRAESPASSPLRRFVDEIIYAGERATALTRHLQAFSRDPAAQPRVLDVSQLVTAMEPMLRRLLGEGIELILLNPRGAGRVNADPAQIEQAIVNLATNARDAMPNGGKLVVEVSAVDLDEGTTSKNLGLKPGPYTMIAISDTGVGMDAATRSRLFEPFFTSKKQTKEGGLGLATVYGAVKQHGGHITVYSQPGCGSIFEIYLPRVSEKVSEPIAVGKRKGSETILLVDDEDGVRKLVLAVLQSHGYEVLEASNGSAALATYEKNAHKIDMVLTDVVMPQMTGFELGAQLSGRTPSLKILYMSGYRDNATGFDERPKAFLHKPFTPDVLLTKVREVLDGVAR